MHSTRSILVLAAALTAAGCAPDAESTRTEGRDLTLASAPATEAIVGPAELVRPPAAPRAAAGRAAPAPRPRIARRQAMPAAPEVTAEVEAPAPAVVSPTPPAVEPLADAWTGAGTALEPGQSVGVVPVAMGEGSRMPPTDLVSERGIRWMGMVHGDDRCIPGRDEMVPGFRARRN